MTQDLSFLKNMSAAELARTFPNEILTKLDKVYTLAFLSTELSFKTTIEQENKIVDLAEDMYRDIHISPLPMHCYFDAICEWLREDYEEDTIDEALTKLENASKWERMEILDKYF